MTWPLRLEHWALVGLAAVLPLLEAPKNLLWLAYVSLWLWNRARARDFGGPWDAWDSLILAWLISGYASVAFAGIEPLQWREANDLLRYSSVLWLLRRSHYSEQWLRRIVAALVAGTLAALALGYYWLFWTHERYWLELKSVGFVNHSAIYLAIVLGVAAIDVRARWAGARSGWKALWLAILGACVVSLFVMQSRAAVGAAFITTTAVLAVYAWRTRLGRMALAFGVLAAVALVALIRPQVVHKNEDVFLAYRDGIWRAGLATWRQFPVFGVGLEHYRKAGEREHERWSAQRGERLDKSRLVFSTHGHSLYVTTLAERGVVGLGALLLVLAGWGLALARSVPGAAAPPAHWTWWGGAASAWLITVMVGLVNTTLHHEHALLSMLLLGGWLSIARAHRSRN